MTHGRLKFSVVSVALSGALLCLALAGCSSQNTSKAGATGTAQTAQTAQTTSKTTATHLALTAKGTPNLKGWTIPIATAGSHPGAQDTLGYIMEKTLEKWGATSSLNLGEAPEGADAVVAGKIDAINSDMPSLLNLPLEIFMPNQDKLDYVFVSTKATSLKDLKGTVIDVGTKTSLEYFLMPALLKKAGLTKTQVTEDITGSSSGSSIGTTLVAGRAQAAWIHIGDLSKLKAELPSLHVLANAATTLPTVADSFWAARPAWLQKNPAIAEALCLAWIVGAKVFNDQVTQWVNYAEQYTNNANPASTVKATHKILASLHLWPVSKSAYSKTFVKQNFDFDNQYGLLSGAGIRPLGTVAEFTSWNAAWKVYNAHSTAY